MRHNNPPLNLQRVAFLLWNIWKLRNATVFNNAIFNPLLCLIKAKKAIAEWSIRTCMSVDNFNGGPFSPPRLNNLFVRWIPPQPEFVRLFFDGSRNHISTAGGFFIRDWTGKLLKVGASYYGEVSIFVAEACALQDGVYAMIQAGFKR